MRWFRIQKPLFAARNIVVGPRTSIPSATSTPQFGRRRRRLRERELVASCYVENDEDAKEICFSHYGFIQKPLYMATWQEFLRELRRFELQWSLAPGPGGIYQLKIYDHAEPGDGLLCELKGAGCSSAPIADVFEACGCITEGSINVGAVRFLEGLSDSTLRIESKKRLGETTIADEKPILPGLTQHNCRGTSVNISVLDNKSRLVTPLFSDLSVQTLNYAFITSLPAFLKRTDVGIRNSDFVTKDQMRHFRFAWCFLRKESWMTPVEMGELDSLLPP